MADKTAAETRVFIYGSMIELLAGMDLPDEIFEALGFTRDVCTRNSSSAMASSMQSSIAQMKRGQRWSGCRNITAKALGLTT
jgi:hypothetical protein